MSSTPKLNIERVVLLNNPEGAYVAGRIEAQAELVEFMRTIAEAAELGLPVADAISELCDKHDAMIRDINAGTWGGRPRAAGKRITADVVRDRTSHDLMGPETKLAGRLATAMLKRNIANREEG